MLSSEDQILIEKYFQGSLDEEASAAFLNRLEIDVAFFKRVMALQVLEEASLDLHYKDLAEEVKEDKNGEFLDFKKALESAELDVYLEEEILQPLQQNRGSETTYSLEELLADFQVVPAYEEMMLTEERGEMIEVLEPINRFHCKNRVLTFTLKEALTSAFSLRIENNQMKAVFKQKFPTNSAASFTITLPDDAFPPGLYYWKLWNRNGTVMGSFLVGI